MSEKVLKLEPEEVEAIKSLNEKYNSLYLDMGQQAFQIDEYKKLIEQCKAVIETNSNSLRELSEQQESLSKELSHKYGSGVIDLETGTITIKTV